MKKLLSTLLVIAMVLSLSSITAFAAPITEPGSTDTTVTYTVSEPSYSVTIPASAELNKEFTVKAEDIANLQTNQAVTVKVTEWTKSTTGNGFALAKGSEYIPCTVKRGESGSEIALGDRILTADSDGTAPAPLYILITNPDAVYSPGTYTGTMTFTIAIENIGK